MIGLTHSTRVFLATEPTDMRRSFDGLSALVRTVIGGDPLSGHLFVFTNRSRNRLKIIYWDGSGLWVLAKRLEKGTFAWPDATSACGKSRMAIRPEELAALIGGLDLNKERWREWYRRDAAMSA
jgi:transposase